MTPVEVLRHAERIVADVFAPSGKVFAEIPYSEQVAGEEHLTEVDLADQVWAEGDEAQQVDRYVRPAAQVLAQAILARPTTAVSPIRLGCKRDSITLAMRTV